jgi:Arc/MetJ-type ribon-helix-helix transcriptional regulator
MSDHSDKYWAPLTFDLTLPQIQKIEAVRRARGLRSASEVVRLAIASFEIQKYAARRARYRQLSVRIDPVQREKLRRQAKRKYVSIGTLVRAALETMPTKARKTGR